MPSLQASPAAGPSPQAVHHLVCEFVAAQAEVAAGSGWTEYSQVFLSAEVQGLIRSRLPGAGSPPPTDSVGDGGGGGGSKKKKRKLDADVAAVADVSWTVCCLDGTTFSVAVPEDTRVAEMKRAIGRQREVAHFSFEVFVKGEEEPLDDERRLLSAKKVPLFMLPKDVSDRLALEALFKSCGGADWNRKQGWTTDTELAEWEGVKVDAEGRVTELDLEENNLAGSLPSELQQLSALTFLCLHGNNLSGPIPPELGQLEALADIRLGCNQLSGPIPAELGQLGALTNLYLFKNALSGPIPVELGQLGALKSLSLEDNKLTGPIPVELAQAGAGALVGLDLSNNDQLSGQRGVRESMAEHKAGGCELEL